MAMSPQLTLLFALHSRDPPEITSCPVSRPVLPSPAGKKRRSKTFPPDSKSLISAPLLRSFNSALVFVVGAGRRSGRAALFKIRAVVAAVSARHRLREKYFSERAPAELEHYKRLAQPRCVVVGDFVLHIVIVGTSTGRKIRKKIE